MIKLGKLVQVKNSLVKLVNADLPVREAYNLSKTLKRIEEELKTADEIRISLIKKIGQEVMKDDKPTGETRILPEDQERFFTEYNQLLDVEVDIPACKINLNQLNGAKLSAVDIVNLDFILEGESDNVG